LFMSDCLYNLSKARQEVGNTLDTSWTVRYFRNS
jgi:hypothetical protein